jgi:hypothetical protein
MWPNALGTVYKAERLVVYQSCDFNPVEGDKKKNCELKIVGFNFQAQIYIVSHLWLYILSMQSVPITTKVVSSNPRSWRVVLDKT